MRVCMRALKIGDAGLGRIQCLTEQQCALHKKIGCIRLPLERSPDHQVGFRDFVDSMDLHELIEKILKSGAFLGIHDCSPPNMHKPGAVYSVGICRSQVAHGIAMLHAVSVP